MSRRKKSPKIPPMRLWTAATLSARGSRRGSARGFRGPAAAARRWRGRAFAPWFPAGLRGARFAGGSLRFLRFGFGGPGGRLGFARLPALRFARLPRAFGGEGACRGGGGGGGRRRSFGGLGEMGRARDRSTQGGGRMARVAVWSGG